MTVKIFINYRRDDDPGSARALFGELEKVFPRQQLFMDVDNIGPGRDFAKVLKEQVAQCDVLISVIGKNWIDARDESGGRRLDSPEDYVRIEIESALTQEKRVIPVLVGQAQMPRVEQLPDGLKPLARLQAVRLTHERFSDDARGLVKALEEALGEADGARPPPTSRRATRRVILIGGALAAIAGAVAVWIAVLPKLPPVVTAIACPDMGVTDNAFGYEIADLASAIRADVGSNARPAEWSEVKACYEKFGLGYFHKLGIGKSDASHTAARGNRVLVLVNGARYYVAPPRAYFAAFHEGTVPPGGLAHDQVGGYQISLGSWEDPLPALYVVSKQADGPSR
jgi:hypothetical protein